MIATVLVMTVDWIIVRMTGDPLEARGELGSPEVRVTSCVFPARVCTEVEGAGVKVTVENDPSDSKTEEVTGC